MNPLLRAILLLIVALTLFLPAYAQWNLEWTSTGLPSGVLGGWVSFQGSGDNWQQRYYTLDTLAFRIMGGALSAIPQYVHPFTPAERLAGELIYSLGVDLTGDNIVEFYAVSAYGTAAPYRKSVKVFDITNGQTVFERNVADYSYSDATVWDVNSDGIYECVFTRSDYPSFSTVAYEVYNTGVSGASPAHPPLPQKLDLHQNYPNPFNPSTRIDYELRTAGRVELEIVNVMGQKVRTLVDGMQSAGAYSASWDGADGSGAMQASGPYYYQIRINGQPQQTRQMILLK